MEAVCNKQPYCMWTDGVRWVVPDHGRYFPVF